MDHDNATEDCSSSDSTDRKRRSQDDTRDVVEGSPDGKRYHFDLGDLTEEPIEREEASPLVRSSGDTVVQELPADESIDSTSPMSEDKWSELSEGTSGSPIEHVVIQPSGSVPIVRSKNKVTSGFLKVRDFAQEAGPSSRPSSPKGEPEKILKGTAELLEDDFVVLSFNDSSGRSSSEEDTGQNASATSGKKQPAKPPDASQQVELNLALEEESKSASKEASSSAKSISWASIVVPAGECTVQETRIQKLRRLMDKTVAKLKETKDDPDWSEHISTSGHTYYHNSFTGVSTWVKPNEFGEQSSNAENKKTDELHRSAIKGVSRLRVDLGSKVDIKQNDSYKRLLNQLVQIFPKLEQSRLEEFAKTNYMFEDEGDLGTKMEVLFKEQEAKEREEEPLMDQDGVAFRKHTHYLSRTYNTDDPVEQKARVAEGIFMRMVSKSAVLGGISLLNNTEHSIASIDVIENPLLEAAFVAKKEELRDAGRPCKELLLFHGTHVTNIESILRGNFDLGKAVREAYGRGIYFSEFPSISLGYGNGLILCRVLPGLVQKSGSRLDRSFDSFSVNTRVNTRTSLLTAYTAATAAAAPSGATAFAAAPSHQSTNKRGVKTRIRTHMSTASSGALQGGSATSTAAQSSAIAIPPAPAYLVTPATSRKEPIPKSWIVCSPPKATPFTPSAVHNLPPVIPRGSSFKPKAEPAKEIREETREIHVIKEPSQILPFCVIHLNRDMAGMTTSHLLSSNYYMQSSLAAATRYMRLAGKNLGLQTPSSVTSIAGPRVCFKCGMASSIDPCPYCTSQRCKTCHTMLTGTMRRCYNCQPLSTSQTWSSGALPAAASPAAPAAPAAPAPLESGSVFSTAVKPLFNSSSPFWPLGALPATTATSATATSVTSAPSGSGLTSSSVANPSAMPREKCCVCERSSKVVYGFGGYACQDCFDFFAKVVLGRDGGNPPCLDGRFVCAKIDILFCDGCRLGRCLDAGMCFEQLFQARGISSQDAGAFRRVIDMFLQSRALVRRSYMTTPTVSDERRTSAFPSSDEAAKQAAAAAAAKPQVVQPIFSAQVKKELGITEQQNSSLLRCPTCEKEVHRELIKNLYGASVCAACNTRFNRACKQLVGGLAPPPKCNYRCSNEEMKSCYSCFFLVCIDLGMLFERTEAKDFGDIDALKAKADELVKTARMNQHFLGGKSTGFRPGGDSQTAGSSSASNRPINAKAAMENIIKELERLKVHLTDASEQELLAEICSRIGAYKNFTADPAHNALQAQIMENLLQDLLVKAKRVIGDHAKEEIVLSSDSSEMEESE